MKKSLIYISAILLIFLSACTSDMKNYENTDAMLKDAISASKLINIEDFKTVFDNKEAKILIVDCREESEFVEGHIPGAIEMDTLLLESPETWNRRSSEELKVALESKGISADTTVILYGRFGAPDNNDAFPGSSAGHLGAIRNAAIMMYAGVKDVRVLNGGLLSWKNAGFEIIKEASYPKRVYDFGVKVPGNPSIFIDTDEAKKYIKADTKEIVSIRSWAEYIGEVSGYNYIKIKGRIPGSVFGNCGTDAYHMENYRNIDHTTREYQEVEAQLKAAGLSSDKHLAFYCGTGWRGSEAFFNAYLLGWPNVSIYDGGWFEWSNDSKNKFEIGIPEK